MAALLLLLLLLLLLPPWTSERFALPDPPARLAAFSAALRCSSRCTQFTVRHVLHLPAQRGVRFAPLAHRGGVVRRGLGGLLLLHVRGERLEGSPLVGSGARG